MQGRQQLERNFGHELHFIHAGILEEDVIKCRTDLMSWHATATTTNAGVSRALASGSIAVQIAALGQKSNHN